MGCVRGLLTLPGNKYYVKFHIMFSIMFLRWGMQMCLYTNALRLNANNLIYLRCGALKVREI